MELIKKLNEDARTSMDRDTFDRLVRLAKDEIENNLKRPEHADEMEMMDIILEIIENVAGFEDPDEAGELAERVLLAVKGSW